MCQTPKKKKKKCEGERAYFIFVLYSSQNEVSFISSEIYTSEAVHPINNVSRVSPTPPPQPVFLLKTWAEISKYLN